MEIPAFLELFVKEIEINRDLQGYYRLLRSRNRFLWRKAYLEQRLTYVSKHLGVQSGNIWDVGCGYATTAIFLALNGHKVMGNTLEFYYDKINARLDYWNRYGNLDNLKIEYSNLYDMPASDSQYDVIIAQDVLHHLRPVEEALDILNKSLKQNGRLIVSEENGSNVFIMLKNLFRRGCKGTLEYYDERLEKTIVMCNECTRSLHAWQKILLKKDLRMVDFEYIRFLPPRCFSNRNYHERIHWEKKTARKTTLLREIFFFGINFTTVNTMNEQYNLEYDTIRKYPG